MIDFLQQQTFQTQDRNIYQDKMIDFLQQQTFQTSCRMNQVLPKLGGKTYKLWKKILN